MIITILYVNLHNYEGCIDATTPPAMDKKHFCVRPIVLQQQLAEQGVFYADTVDVPCLLSRLQQHLLL